MSKAMLIRAWLDSYKRDRNHALRDAETNLKGFTECLKKALEHFSVDFAFQVAIKQSLKGVK